jgi:hypothetical protein
MFSAPEVEWKILMPTAFMQNLLRFTKPVAKGNALMALGNVCSRKATPALLDLRPNPLRKSAIDREVASFLLAPDRCEPLMSLHLWRHRRA